MRSIDLQVDVTEAAALGEPAHVALTVTVPEELGPEPVVCFAKPGGGYARGYYTVDLPGPGPGHGAQADWHAARGWVFVSVDHLGVGDSSLHDPESLSYTPVVAASQAAEADVLQKLAAGTLIDGLPPVERPLTIGIGQSMGGCLTVVQQGRSTTATTASGCSATACCIRIRRLRPGRHPSSCRGSRATCCHLRASSPMAPRWRTSTRPQGRAPMPWPGASTTTTSTPRRRATRPGDFPTRGGDPPPWGSATVP